MKTNWLGFIYFLWWLMSGVDGVGAFMAGIRLREIGRIPQALSPRARRVSAGYVLLMFGLAAESFITVASLYFLESVQGFTATYMLGRLVGRTIKAAVIWRFVFSVLGFRNGKGRDDVPPSPPAVAPEAPEEDRGA